MSVKERRGGEEEDADDAFVLCFMGKMLFGLGFYFLQYLEWPLGKSARHHIASVVRPVLIIRP